ncbi:Ig-like domain-containing protein [Anaeromyxobacter terrae]|uniref:Ig-like domain-containing protein n=1 Tax=Anaeromyxobacter terrae TaxID=2925406 RepID=UPI001F59F734|nr:Ig-like domain-containing protein [Anaeromyxobacter sp. SG22]
MSPATATPGARRATFTALLAATLACSGGSSEEGGPASGACPLPRATALEIADSTPYPGQTGVAVNGDLVIRYNTCLDPASIPGAATLALWGAPVPAAITYDASRAAIVIDPAQPLAYSTTYSVSLSTALRGAHGEVGPVRFFVFTTQATPETIPPTTTATPPGGFYSFPRQVTLVCQDDVGGTGCSVTHYTVDGSNPTAASPAYVAPITVDRSLTLRFFSVDAQGNAEAPRSETYVMDTDPPGVASVFPPDGAIGVRLDTPFHVTFDEPMRDDGALRGAIVAVPAAPGGASYDEPTRTSTAQPAELLECGTAYTLTVSGATDLAGNALPAPTTWSFTTAADCDEPRTTASVASGAYATAQDVTLTCFDGAGSGCERIVYTTDGSIPSFDGGTGTIVQGATAGPIHAGPGETVLRYRAEDAVGHVEVIRENDYSVSGDGFVYVAGGGDLFRGAGRVPTAWVSTGMIGEALELFRDRASGRLYRRLGGRLAYSDDDGATWHHFTVRASDGAPSQLTAAAAFGSRIYVGTDRGLFVSCDAGASFDERHYGIYDRDSVTAIALSDRHGFVGTRSGLLVSHDRMRSSLRHADGVWFTSVAACGDDVYATHSGGVEVSHDAGVTWTTVTAAAGATANHHVACDGTKVYVATDVGLAISTDGGDGFGALRTTAQGLDTNDVRRVAVSGTHVHAATSPLSGGGKSFATSTDGGATFTARSIGIPEHDPAPAAILAEGSTVWVGAAPSLWRSTDAGVTFAPADLTGGIERITGNATELYALVGGGGYSGIAISRDRGRTWPVFRSAYTLAGQGPFKSTTPEDLFLDVGTGKLYVATSYGLSISYDGGSTFDLRTGANDWTNPPSGNAGLNGNSGECVAASGSTVWYGTSGEVWKSTNGGQTFGPRIAMYPNLPNAIAFSGQDVYVATSGGLAVSNDGGATSFALRTESAGIAYPSTVADVFIASSGDVYVADGRQVEVSTDRGASFTALAATAGTYPKALLVTPDSAIWVGGSSELGVSTDAGATFRWWDVWNSGISGVTDVHVGP